MQAQTDVRLTGTNTVVSREGGRERMNGDNCQPWGQTRHVQPVYFDVCVHFDGAHVTCFNDGDIAQDRRLDRPEKDSRQQKPSCDQ
jgi:hypothetical protein